MSRVGGGTKIQDRQYPQVFADLFQAVSGDLCCRRRVETGKLHGGVALAQGEDQDISLDQFLCYDDTVDILPAVPEQRARDKTHPPYVTRLDHIEQDLPFPSQGGDDTLRRETHHDLPQR